MVQAGGGGPTPPGRGAPLTEEALRQVLGPQGRGDRSIQCWTSCAAAMSPPPAGGAEWESAARGHPGGRELLSLSSDYLSGLQVPPLCRGGAPCCPAGGGGELSQYLILSPRGWERPRCCGTSSAVSPWGGGASRRVGVADRRGSWARAPSAASWAPGPMCWRTAPRPQPC